MCSRHETQQLAIDITIDRVALKFWSAMLLIGLVLSVGLISAASSPMVRGHPVLLTRNRLAIKHYLDAVEGWIVRMDDIGRQLDALDRNVSSVVSPTVSTTPPPLTATLRLTTPLPTRIDLPTEKSLPALGQPASLPSSLYEHAQQAERAMQVLRTMDLDMQRIETPAALSGLHALALTTLHYFAQWSTVVLDAISAPSPNNLAAIQPARSTALASFEVWRSALTAQLDPTP